MLGLVLTAGGARGAYQAGILKRVAELPSIGAGPSPFAIVAGASARQRLVPGHRGFDHLDTATSTICAA